MGHVHVHVAGIHVYWNSVLLGLYNAGLFPQHQSHRFTFSVLFTIVDIVNSTRYYLHVHIVFFQVICLVDRQGIICQCLKYLTTRQSVAVQREGGIPVGKKILHPYQNP